MSEPAAPIVRPVEDLQRLRDLKRAELATVEDELSTAQWLADYDQAEMA